MKKSLLITYCVLSWFIMWFILALIMYTVAHVIFSDLHYTFYECIFYEFVIASQFIMGWVPAILIYDEYKAKLLIIKA